MKRLVLILIMFSFFSKGYADYSKLAYDFKFNSIDGGQINLDNYREKVIVKGCLAPIFCTSIFDFSISVSGTGGRIFRP